MTDNDQDLHDSSSPADKTTGASDDHTSQIDYEAEARKLGWRPESEYKGKGPFVDAKTFYENGQVVLPIIRAENKALRDELVRVKDNAVKMSEHFRQGKEREVADLTRQLEEARAARRQAISEGNGDEVDRLETTIDDTKTKIAEAKREVAPPSNTPQIDPTFEAWLNGEGSWYRDDARLRAMADAMLLGSDGKISPEFAHLKGRGAELYNAVGTAVKELDAAMKGKELSRPGPRGGGTGVEGGGGTVRSSAQRRSYSNLQPEFKKTCDDMARDFGYSGKAKEKFQADYAAACADDAFRG